MPSGLSIQDFVIFSPVILLTIWGLLSLIFDLTLLAGQDPTTRNRALGMWTLAGLVGSLVLSQFLSYKFMGPSAGTDPQIFFGSLNGGVLFIQFTSLVILFAVLITCLSMVWNFTSHWGEYYAMLIWSSVSMILLIAAEDLLTLFLALETMTICLYLMTAMEKSKQRSAEAGLKYFVYGSVSSALFLFGISLVYGMTGTLSIAEIGHILSSTEKPGLTGNVVGGVAVLMILVGFGFKVSAVPFHQWAPDVYEGAPTPVSAWLASGSKLASLVAMVKVMGGGLGSWASTNSPTSPGWVGLLALISAATMTYGNFAALGQTNLKRLLAYSSIAHAGYMLVGVIAVGLSTEPEEAAAALFFYLVVYGLTTIAGFALAAWIDRDRGTEEVEDLNGLARRHPYIGVAVCILMLSMIGIPPTAGFFGKLYMFMEALNVGGTDKVTMVGLVALGLFNSVVSAFYYIRILKAMFFRESDRADLKPMGPEIALPLGLGAVLTLFFGFNSSILLSDMESVSRSGLHFTQRSVNPDGYNVPAPGVVKPAALKEVAKPAPVTKPAPAAKSSATTTKPATPAKPATGVPVAAPKS
jgi:NADH-quinone oxidoreductase subunit N